MYNLSIMDRMIPETERYMIIVRYRYGRSYVDSFEHELDAKTFLVRLILALSNFPSPIASTNNNQAYFAVQHIKRIARQMREADLAEEMSHA